MTQMYTDKDFFGFLFCESAFIRVLFTLEKTEAFDSGSRTIMGRGLRRCTRIKISAHGANSVKLKARVPYLRVLFTCVRKLPPHVSPHEPRFLASFICRFTLFCCVGGTVTCEPATGNRNTKAG